MPCPNMRRDLHLKEGLVGSHINYIVGDIQMQMAELLGVVTMDMGQPLASAQFGRGGVKWLKCDLVGTSSVALGTS